METNAWSSATDTHGSVAQPAPTTRVHMSLDPDIHIPAPKLWNVIMEEGRFTSNDSTAIKEIIDKILDTFEGAIPNEKLRKEMEMQRSVFFNCRDVYELFIWSFEESAPDLLGLLRRALDCMQESDADITVVATAVTIHLGRTS